MKCSVCILHSITRSSWCRPEVGQRCSASWEQILAHETRLRFTPFYLFPCWNPRQEMRCAFSPLHSPWGINWLLKRLLHQIQKKRGKKCLLSYVMTHAAAKVSLMKHYFHCCQESGMMEPILNRKASSNYFNVTYCYYHTLLNPPLYDCWLPLLLHCDAGNSMTFVWY